MRLVEDILKGKHFPEGSRERLKATLISLMILLATMIMLIDVYESIVQKHYAMSLIESSSAFILIVLYLLFPQKISLQKTINVSVIVIGFLFIISLTVRGANPQFALFWLSTLPIYIFFFFGLKLGIKWTGIALFALFLTLLNALFSWYPALYKADFLLQLWVGYLAISYLLYSLEKERQGYEENLQKSVLEKEVLLKEVHHRTKNNMQIMMALLETQSFKIDDPKYKKMFQAHVDRLKAMALVHENLYHGESYETVEIDSYLKDITQHLQSLTEHTISTNIEKIELNMKTAMNLGLVYNEALSNAIAHAYKEGEVGEIEVSLRREGSTQCILEVHDHGKGFDMEKEHKTMGLTLMHDISRTLEGNALEISNDGGIKVKVYCALKEDER